MKTKGIWTALVLAATTLSFFACGGPKKPEWITNPGAAFKKDKKTFHGVGVVEGVQSVALRRTTAENRAIAEISKQLSVMSTSLMRDYMASTSVPAEAKGNEEQYIENTVKTFTDNMISGVKFKEYYEEPKTNTMYVLAALSLDDMQALAGQAQKLSQEVRDYIKANAESAFDKMSMEQEKRSGQ